MIESHARCSQDLSKSCMSVKRACVHPAFHWYQMSGAKMPRRARATGELRAPRWHRQDELLMPLPLTATESSILLLSSRSHVQLHDAKREGVTVAFVRYQIRWRASSTAAAVQARSRMTAHVLPNTKHCKICSFALCIVWGLTPRLFVVAKQCWYVLKTTFPDGANDVNFDSIAVLFCNYSEAQRFGPFKN